MHSTISIWTCKPWRALEGRDRRERERKKRSKIGYEPLAKRLAMSRRRWDEKERKKEREIRFMSSKERNKESEREKKKR